MGPPGEEKRKMRKNAVQGTVSAMLGSSIDVDGWEERYVDDGECVREGMDR